jgi:hypothetical protein
MEEIGQTSSDHQEMDLSDRPEWSGPEWTDDHRTELSDKKDKRVKFDFNHVLII